MGEVTSRMVYSAVQFVIVEDTVSTDLSALPPVAYLLALIVVARWPLQPQDSHSYISASSLKKRLYSLFHKSCPEVSQPLLLSLTDTHGGVGNSPLTAEEKAEHWRKNTSLPAGKKKGNRSG